MQTVSLVKHLEEQLKNIEELVVKFITASSIEREVPDPFDDSPFIAVVNNYYWGEDNDDQKRVQLKMLRTYAAWFEHFNLLFHGSPQETQTKITETNTSVREWIEKKNGWNVPRSIADAIKLIHEDFAVYYQLLKVFATPKQADMILVPDTNALIRCPDVTRFKESVDQPNYTVILISTVLGELDKLKRDHRDMDFRKKVDSVIRRIKGLRQQGNMREGVIVNKTVTVKMQAEEPNFDETLSWLDPENADDRIIANILEIQRKEPSSMVILITADINHQNKAEAANLPFVEPPASISNN